MQSRKKIFLVILCMFSLFASRWCITAPEKYNQQYGLKQKNTPKIVTFLGEILEDAISLLSNLFSLSSVKVLTSFTPLYLISRMHDECIQSHFYDASSHTNINQFPHHCHSLAHYGVGVPMVGLSSLAIFACDEDLRLTGRMFAIGLPFVHSGKDIIKKLRFKACLRPWHEKFDRHRRSSGGFPSGHMANVVYIASLFGMRHGPAWGIPLGLFAGFVFADFLNCNRHYFSQLVAGAGLGLIFALAASKVVDKRLSQICSFTCGVDNNGNPAAQFSYQF